MASKRLLKSNGLIEQCGNTNVDNNSGIVSYLISYNIAPCVVFTRKYKSHGEYGQGIAENGVTTTQFKMQAGEGLGGWWIATGY